MTRKLRIEGLLSNAIAFSQIDVRDDSHLHAGHGGSRPEGETHYHLYLVSSAFESVSKVKRHQMIYGILEPEMKGDKAIHALSMTLLSESEA